MSVCVKSYQIESRAEAARARRQNGRQRRDVVVVRLDRASAYSFFAGAQDLWIEVAASSALIARLGDEPAPSPLADGACAAFKF